MLLHATLLLALVVDHAGGPGAPVDGFSRWRRGGRRWRRLLLQDRSEGRREDARRDRQRRTEGKGTGKEITTANAIAIVFTGIANANAAASQSCSFSRSAKTDVNAIKVGKVKGAGVGVFEKMALQLRLLLEDAPAAGLEALQHWRGRRWWSSSSFLCLPPAGRFAVLCSVFPVPVLDQVLAQLPHKSATLLCLAAEGALLVVVVRVLLQ